MFESQQSGVLLDLLSASSLRARVLSANVANQNTPGYRRQEVAFEDELLRALESSSGRPEEVTPEVLADEVSPAKPDGNNVDLEREMTEVRANRLLYETFTTILNGRFELLSSAIHGDR